MFLVRYPTGILCIIAMEFLAWFAFCGIRTLLSLYLRNVLLLPESTSTVIYHGFNMICFATPVLSAIIADGYLGRYNTVLCFSIICTVGSIVQFLAASTVTRMNTLLWAMIGEILVAVGAGGVKPCIAAFAGDQFFLPEHKNLIQPFFSLFYFMANLGGLSGMILTPVLRDATSCLDKESCYVLAFGVPTIAMIISLGIFVLGQPFYRIKAPEENMIGQFIKCLWNSNKVRNRNHNKRNPRLHCSKPEHDTNLKKDVKRMLGVCLLFIPLPVFWSLQAQQASRWTFQASRMNGNIFGIQILPDQVPALNPAVVLLLIPFFQKVIYPSLIGTNVLATPLQKMHLGGLMASLAFTFAAILELKLEEAYPVVTYRGEATIVLVNTLPCDVTILTSYSRSAIARRGQLLTYTTKRLPIKGDVEFSISPPLKCGPRIIEKHTTFVRVKVATGETNTVLLTVTDHGVAEAYVLYQDDLSKPLSGRPKMRNYIRKTNQKSVTESTFQQVKEMKAKGLSNRAIAKELGFSEGAIRASLKKGHGAESLGRFKRVFTETQEIALVEHLKELDKRFYGLSFKSLRFYLFNYAEQNKIASPFNKDAKAAGKDFAINFMKRHRLSLRTPRKTSVARTMGFNKVQMKVYFDNLKCVFDRYKFGPESIFNMDETGIQTVPGKLPKVVTPTGKRDVSKNVSSEQGKTITVVCCAGASGNYIPPFFIFGRKRLPDLLIRHGPSGCAMAATEKGYMNSPTFLKWLDHFKKYANPTDEKPALLILDNHASHTNLEAITLAKENHIIMVTLPPHSSHKTQPLDRVFFKPLKANYDEVTDNWLSSHPGQTITVFHLAELFKVAYERTATIEKATTSFRVTGIMPLDPTVFTEEDFIPSEVTDQPLDDLEKDDLCKVNFNERNSDSDETSKSIEVPVCDPIPGPSSSCPVDEPEITVSPAAIVPIPKLAVQRKRRRKGLKSAILTSTPHKTDLEEKMAMEVEKEAEKKKRMEAKRSKRMLTYEDSSSDEDLLPIVNDDESEVNWEGSDSSSENEDLGIGRFAVAKVSGKNSFRFFVVEIVTLTDDGFNVFFYKKAEKVFKFRKTNEEGFVLKTDIVMNLSKPIQASSGRFQDMVSFTTDLEEIKNILD